tara:strand:+ start:1870 stop:2190 length:321 start_codon:yes stop_codon:yes gene_type:complete
MTDKEIRGTQYMYFRIRGLSGRDCKMRYKFWNKHKRAGNYYNSDELMKIYNVCKCLSKKVFDKYVDSLYWGFHMKEDHYIYCEVEFYEYALVELPKLVISDKINNF